jgi:hypothetical protein
MEVEVQWFLNSVLGELTGQLYVRAALPMRRDPCAHQMANWTTGLVWTIWRRENSLTSARNEPQVYSFTAGNLVTHWHDCLVLAGLEVDMICGNKLEAAAGQYVIWVGAPWHVSVDMVQSSY